MPKRWTRKPEILLLPNIPQPLHGVNPRSVLGNQWWNKTRQAAYASTNYHCEACGVHKKQARTHQWLEGHEVYETYYLLGELHYVRTTPLCHCCHNYIHDNRLTALLKKGEISRATYTLIIQHGNQVLREAGLKRLSNEQRVEQIRELTRNNQIAKWSQWRLVVNGNSYPPKYKTRSEWEKAYA